MTSTNWLATPTCLILSRFSHISAPPLPLPHIVKGKNRCTVENSAELPHPVKVTCSVAFFFDAFCSLYLAKWLCFCLPGHWSVTVMSPSFIYTVHNTRPLSAKMCFLAALSVISLLGSFTCTMHEFMEMCAHCKLKRSL